MFLFAIILYLSTIKSITSYYYDRSGYDTNKYRRRYVPQGHRYWIDPTRRNYIVDTLEHLLEYRNLSDTQYLYEERPPTRASPLRQRVVPSTCRILSGPPRICGSGLSQKMIVMVDPERPSFVDRLAPTPGDSNGGLRFYCRRLVESRPCVQPRGRDNEKETGKSMVVNIYIVDGGEESDSPRLQSSSYAPLVRSMLLKTTSFNVVRAPTTAAAQKSSASPEVGTETTENCETTIVTSSDEPGNTSPPPSNTDYENLSSHQQVELEEDNIGDMARSDSKKAGAVHARSELKNEYSVKRIYGAK